MKKYFIFIILFCLVFSGCGSNNVKAKNDVEIAVNDIVINKSHAYVDKGDKIILLAQVFPFNSDNQKIHWKSDNPNVASVDDGIVVGKSEGRTVITATSDDGDISASCIVYVSNPKLDYEKYENNLNFENQNVRRNSNNNFISNFKAERINNNINNNIFNQINSFRESVKSIESFFDNIKLNYEIMSKNISSVIDSEKASSVKNNGFNFKTITEESEKEITQENNNEENVENNESELNDNKNYVYSYQYYYNSNGISEEVLEDENTIYKDDNTIIKEKVSLL